MVDDDRQQASIDGDENVGQHLRDDRSPANSGADGPLPSFFLRSRTGAGPLAPGRAGEGLRGERRVSTTKTRVLSEKEQRGFRGCGAIRTLRRASRIVPEGFGILARRRIVGELESV